MIAAKWTWLQAQIADIEYRIRLHADLHKQIRSNKGMVALGGPNCLTSTALVSSQTAVNGYCGQLPGSSGISAKLSSVVSDNSEEVYQCARTRPLVAFKKRKLLQISGLHAVSKRAARPSTMKCGCVPLGVPCALCTGRSDPTHPRDAPDTLSRSEMIALLDPGFHPVFSLPEGKILNQFFRHLMLNKNSVILLWDSVLAFYLQSLRIFFNFEFRAGLSLLLE